MHRILILLLALLATTFAAEQPTSLPGGAVVGRDNPAGTANTAGLLKFWSGGNNAFFTIFQAGTQTGSVTYTLPTAQAAVGGQVLTDAAANGVLSWATPGINLTVPSGAGTYSGTTVTMTSTETQALGDAVQIDSAGKCHLAKADSLAHASAVFICVSAPSGSASATYAMPGSIIKLAASASWTAGNVIYLSVTGTTTNTLTKTAPSTSTNIVQILGVALANDTLLFQPSLVQVTVL